MQELLTYEFLDKPDTILDQYTKVIAIPPKVLKYLSSKLEQNTDDSELIEQCLKIGLNTSR